MSNNIIGYVVVKKDGDNNFLFLQEDHKTLSKELCKKTEVFLTANSAVRLIYGMSLKFNDELFVYQLVTDKDVDHEVTLWKVTDSDVTTVSYVVVGFVKGRRVYYTDRGEGTTDRLVDATKIHALNEAVKIKNDMVSLSGNENPKEDCACVTDVHIENVTEEFVSVDINQDPITIKITM